MAAHQHQHMITYYVPGMEETKMARHCSYPQGVHRQVQVKLMLRAGAVGEVVPMRSQRRLFYAVEWSSKLWSSQMS